MRYDIAVKKLREAMIVSQEEPSQYYWCFFKITVNKMQEKKRFEPTIKVKRKLNELFIKYDI